MSNTNQIQKIDLDKVDWRGSREFFESLSDELRSLDDANESYDFTWVGKRKAVIEAGAPINKTLRPDVENSKNWDTTENLFIEGDNLDALKLLQESYLGKVKMIYIDPPYNTGKDFVYHDNFRATTEQYDEDTEYKDDDGNIQFKKNEKTNGRYHSDWLSMMYPRLKLARNLLSDDGVIFISIDDNEQANLKKLCDEIFGEDNYIETLKWKRKKQPSFLAKHTAKMMEYILVYAKNGDSLEKLSIEGLSDATKKVVNNTNPIAKRIFTAGVRVKAGGDGVIKAGEYRIKTMTVAYESDVNYVDGRTTHSVEVTAQFSVSQEKINEYIANDLLFITTNNGLRRDVSEEEKSTRKSITDMLLDWGDNQDSDNEMRSLFNQTFFDYTKPTKLIRNLTQANHTEGKIILDFFSGSATTAHAVMQLNAEDGGNRKWIMVQLPEETEEKSEAFKAGYKTIPEISRERIRRAGDKIASEHPDAKVDYGFRALRIDDTNHKDVYRPAADYQQNMLDELVDNVKEDRSDLDLLYGVLTATAWELNKPLETVELDGATVYKYDYFGEVSGLVACFADEISEEAIKQIAQLKPLTAVFREGSFPDSQAKVNLAEHFRILSPDTKVKVI